ncbi:cation:proton antiporter [bacterium]|nr:cation:proton antiporter [bacterium]
MESHISTIFLLGIAIFVSYFVGKFIHKITRLPSIIGYMIVGVIFGDSVLGIFTNEIMHNLSFITELSLGFIGVLIGLELNMREFRKQGKAVALIILLESFMAFLLVFVGTYLVTKDVALALIYGAMAPASAPAGTVAVIKEYRAHGPMTKALYAVVGFDDGLAILIYAFAASFSKNILLKEATGTSQSLFQSLWHPTLEIVYSIALGSLLGILLGYILTKTKDREQYLVMLFAFVFMATGLSSMLHISLILTNVTMGFIITNTRRGSVVNAINTEMESIVPLIFVMFFFLVGGELNIRILPQLGLLGIVYIITRSGGLISGAYLGGLLGKADKVIRNYLGFGILSQAGVAVGLALITMQRFSQIGTQHAVSIGTSVVTSIAATSIIFETIGPIGAKFALEKAGEINKAPASRRS